MIDQREQLAAAAAESVEALSSVVEKAMEVMYSSRSDVRDLADVIGLDPALTGRLLRLVNSPYYRTMSRPVVSLTEAILRLGYRAVQSALLTTATADLLRPPLPRYGLRRQQFWHHSIAVAISARELARYAHQSHPEEAYVAGLLHDVGKVGMDRRQADAMTLVRQQVRDRNLAYHEAETAELGFDHAHVGELVATRWSLPRDTAAAIGAHHRPDAPPDALTAVVAAANTMAWLAGFPGAADEVPRQISPEVLDRLELTARSLESLIAQVTPVVGEALGLLAGDGA